MKMNIPLSKPYFDDNEIKAVTDVLKSGWVAHGNKNEEFEKIFAEYIGTKYAITVNSCASALQAAIAAIKHNYYPILNAPEIILPSFTYVASANAIVNAGCIPVFCDILYDTCNINPDLIEPLITENTIAIMLVHYAGQSCEMDKIMEIANKYNLEVIEDSAEAIGASYKNKKTGCFGTGCFSFWATKNITTGEGGMITTNKPEIASFIKTYKSHGISTDTFDREKQLKPWERAAILPGYNYRMSNILAAIGVEQMKKINFMNSLRITHAYNYYKLLKNIPDIDLPIISNECNHVYQMFTIKVKNINRDSFVLKLREKGIGASVHFNPPLHMQPFYKQNINLPVTDFASNTIVTLPMYPDLKYQEIKYIARTIKNIMKD